MFFSLLYKKFKLLLKEIESEYGDPLYNKLQWLRRGKVINRFVSLLTEVKIVL